MRSTEIPMSAAAVWLKETARIARPTRVWSTTMRSSSMSPSETTSTISCWLVIVTPAPSDRLFTGTICGKNLGSAPNSSTPPFSSSSETPIAVIRAESRDERRTGL